MYAIEFEAEIKDGVVQIANVHKDLQQKSSEKFIVLVDREKSKIIKYDYRFYKHQYCSFRRLSYLLKNNCAMHRGISTALYNEGHKGGVAL